MIGTVVYADSVIDRALVAVAIALSVISVALLSIALFMP
jgi:hypothetical protein